MLLLAFAMVISLLPEPRLFVSISEHNLRQAIDLSVLELAFDMRARGKYEGSKSIHFAVLPLACELC